MVLRVAQAKGAAAFAVLANNEVYGLPEESTLISRYGNGILEIYRNIFCDFEGMLTTPAAAAVFSTTTTTPTAEELATAACLAPPSSPTATPTEW